MPRFYVPAPDGRGGIEVEVETGTNLRDRSGPPIDVSDRVAPDAVALYCLSIALRDATAAIHRLHRLWLTLGACLAMLLLADIVSLVWAPRWHDVVITWAAGFLGGLAISLALEPVILRFFQRRKPRR